jgi:psp operon transcriptional activator
LPGVRTPNPRLAYSDHPQIDPVSEANALPAPALSGVSDFRAAVLAYERDILIAALDRCRHNQRRTAAALALTYDQLRHALKRHNMLTVEEVEKT